jgi:hypothetical protein
MEASEHRPAVLAGPVHWLSPSLIVSLSLALLAAVIASVYLLQRDPQVEASAPSDATQAARINPHAFIRADPASGEERAAEPVEIRCVQGLRVRKQGNSYSSAGRC